MSLFKALKGNHTALDNVPKHDGYVYFCTDTGSLFFDFTDAEGVLQRKQINANQAETLMGVSLEELKKDFTNQDAVVLHEAQSYTDIALESKADAYDENLTTTDKTIVGSINELNAEVDYLFGNPTQGLAYTINVYGTAYTCTGIGTATDIDIVIPPIYNGLPVTGIGLSAFVNCTSLKSIVVPNSVTSIGMGAFSGCSSLESITLPFVGNTGTSTNSDYDTLFGYIFGDEAYEGGEETTQCYYDVDNDEEIEVTYYIPTSLQSVRVLGGNINTLAFYKCNNLTSIVLDNDVSIAEDSYGIFNSCKALTSIVIPNSVTSIGEFMFSDCTSLSSVVIPDSVDSIGRYAFIDCDNLTKIIIPDSVTSIGESAFQRCASLTSVVIGDSVTSIGSNAFSFCPALTKIVIPDSVTTISDYAFYGCSSLTEIIIPDSVTSIGNYAFYYCSGLSSVVIGSCVTSTGKNTFEGCTSLSSVVIPDSVDSIGYAAFYKCSLLTDVYYTGSETSWADITIGYSNEPLLNATIHYSFANDFYKVNSAINELDIVAVKSVNGELPNSNGEVNIKQLTRTTCTKDLYVGGARESSTYYPNGVVPARISSESSIKNTTYITSFVGLTDSESYCITPVTGSNYLFKIEVTEFDNNGIQIGQYDLDTSRDLEVETFTSTGSKIINTHFTLYYTAKTKIDTSNKTFADEYSGTQRINFGSAGSYSSNLETITPSVKINTTAPIINIKLWWVSGGDGREMQIYKDTGYGKSRLEVSGSFVAHDTAKMGTTTVKALYCDNELVVEGSANFNNAINASSSIHTDGKLKAYEGIETYGTLNMHGNDIKNVQSIAIEGTLKGNGEIFSDKYKPLTDNVGRLGFTDKRFAYGYINNLILSNTPARETNVYYAALANINKLYRIGGYWYYDTTNETGIPLVLEGYDFIEVPSGTRVGEVTLSNLTYYRILSVDDTNHVELLEESNSIDHVHIQAEYQNENDTLKKDLNLITPEDGHLLHNGSPVVTENSLAETIEEVKTTSANMDIAVLTEAQKGIASEKERAEGVEAQLRIDVDNLLNNLLTEEVVDTKIANLVNSAPETLNTLGELATALTTHEDAYDALLETVGSKANKAELAPVATSGLIDDLSIGIDTILIFDGGCMGTAIEITEDATGGESVNIADENTTLTTEDNEAGGQTAIID